MTKDEFVALIEAKLKFNKVDFAAGTAALGAYIDIAFQNLWNEYPWDEKRLSQTITFTSDEYNYTLSDDFEQITGLTIKGDRILPPLDIVSESEFLESYPNISEESAGIPAIAKVVKLSTTGKWQLTIAPKANGDYTMEVIGRRKVPSFDELPNYLLPTLEKMAIASILMPTTEQQMTAEGQAQRSAQKATNITPKAVPVKTTLQAGLKRDGVHRFNFSEGYGCD